LRLRQQRVEGLGTQQRASVAGVYGVDAALKRERQRVDHLAAQVP
jgi:hypothetical protein